MNRVQSCLLAAALAIGASVASTQSGASGATAATPSAGPPAQICGNNATLTGPATAPAGAVTVAAGDNNSLDPAANTTYWFAPGVHTLGTGQFGQIIPADNDTFIGAPGAILDGSHINRYAFTQHAAGVTIKYLTIRNFGPAGGNRDEGVVNHDSGHGWTIQNNTITGNAGAGVFLGTGNLVNYNCLASNEQYGFSAYESGGDANITLDHNEIAGNNTYDWSTKIPGCGCVGGGKFWNTNGATITNNWVHDNKGPGLWGDTNNNDFDFEGNYIAGNDGEGIEYEISYNARIVNNTFIRNALVDGPGNPSFPTGAIYLSEAGGDARVPARYATIEVANNQFTDNWAGVVGWENADRFCGSPANTSGNYCTLVNPATVNLQSCVATTINGPPYYSDCRWKTQNVTIHDNAFSFDPTGIPNCAGTVSCGLQGLFSNYGTYPSWSPYTGNVIEQAITFSQNNHWANNHYTGPWQFMAHDQGVRLAAAAWQTAPYNQDAGSTFSTSPPPTTVPPTTTPPPPPPPPVPTNILEPATATMEGFHWAPRYSSTVGISSDQSHSGKASLKVGVTALYGWGIQLENYPGYPIGAGSHTASFWARAGSGGSVGKPISMVVSWKNANRDDLLVTTLDGPPLSTTWQLATVTVTAPAGTTTGYVTFNGNGAVNDYLYIDDIFVG